MINTKRIYTVASVNGFSHTDVIGYISFEFGVTSTKDLSKEQYNQLLKHLDREEQQMSEKIYAKGLYGKLPSEKAPDFVIGSLSFKVDDFKTFLDDHRNETGWVNISLLKGKEGKINATLDTWQPKKQETQEAPPAPSAPSDDGLSF